MDGDGDPFFIGILASHFSIGIQGFLSLLIRQSYMFKLTINITFETIFNLDNFAKSPEFVCF